MKNEKSKSTIGFSKPDRIARLEMNPIYFSDPSHPLLFSEDGTVMKIPMFNKFKVFKGYAIADVEDARLLLCYSFSKQEYAISSINKSMHALVMGPCPSDMIRDHKNGNPYDCRKVNLRFATASQNAQNCRRNKANKTSKYLGVSKDNNGSKHQPVIRWRAGIHAKGKSYNLGSYDTEEYAATIYDMWSAYYFGVDGGNNGFLTRDQRSWIVDNGVPEEYKRGKKRPVELPENIDITACAKFRFRKKKAGRKGDHAKNFDTLEEAMAHKNKIIAQWAAEDAAAEILRQTNITRNADGIAYIIVKRAGQAFECLVDDHLWGELSKYVWCLGKRGYVKGTVNNVRYNIHGYIYKLLGKVVPKHMSIDHCGRNKLDNRASQLRLADGRLQSHNKEKYGNTLDRFRGVSFTGHSFMVIVEDDTYGCFKSEEEAARIANKIFLQLYGDNAFQNVVPDTVTTKYNRLRPEMITREYVSNITCVKELKHLIRMLKLNEKYGGPYNFQRTKGKDLELIIEEILSNKFEAKIGIHF
jgi:hypothetical protein